MVNKWLLGPPEGETDGALLESNRQGINAFAAPKPSEQAIELTRRSIWGIVLCVLCILIVFLFANFAI
jgi:hypothetical protein